MTEADGVGAVARMRNERLQALENLPIPSFWRTSLQGGAGIQQAPVTRPEVRLPELQMRLSRDAASGVRPIFA